MTLSFFSCASYPQSLQPFKQQQELETKCSNIEAMRDIFHSNHGMSLPPEDDVIPIRDKKPEDVRAKELAYPIVSCSTQDSRLVPHLGRPYCSWSA